jgi:hypothetical protein
MLKVTSMWEGLDFIVTPYKEVKDLYILGNFVLMIMILLRIYKMIFYILIKIYMTMYILITFVFRYMCIRIYN